MLRWLGWTVAGEIRAQNHELVEREKDLPRASQTMLFMARSTAQKRDESESRGDGCRQPSEVNLAEPRQEVPGSRQDGTSLSRGSRTALYDIARPRQGSRSHNAPPAGACDADMLGIDGT